MSTHPDVSGNFFRVFFLAVRSNNARNGTGAKGGLFETLSHEISQLSSPITSIAHSGMCVEF